MKPNKPVHVEREDSTAPSTKPHATFENDTMQPVVRVIKSAGEVSFNNDAEKSSDMATVTKEVLDARLETIETRMDGRISTVEAKLDTKFAELRADMYKGFSDLTRWIIATALGVGGLSIAIMSFMLNNAVLKAGTSTAPPPVIVYAQPAPLPTQPPAKP